MFDDMLQPSDWSDYDSDIDADNTNLPDKYQFPQEPLRTVQRVWANDGIIKRFQGDFAGANCFADLDADLKAAPGATTWAGVQLWQWWSPPTGAGHEGDTRIVCDSRNSALYTSVMSGYRASKSKTLPHLPGEMWICIFGFLEHDDAPYYAESWADEN